MLDRNLLKSELLSQIDRYLNSVRYSIAAKKEQLNEFHLGWNPYTFIINNQFVRVGDGSEITANRVLNMHNLKSQLKTILAHNNMDDESLLQNLNSILTVAFNKNTDISSHFNKTYYTHHQYEAIAKRDNWSTLRLWIYKIFAISSTAAQRIEDAQDILEKYKKTVNLSKNPTVISQQPIPSAPDDQDFTYGTYLSSANMNFLEQTGSAEEKSSARYQPIASIPPVSQLPPSYNPSITFGSGTMSSKAVEDFPATKSPLQQYSSFSSSTFGHISKSLDVSHQPVISKLG